MKGESPAGDLILGAISGLAWTQIRPWAVSLRESGFSGKAVLVVFEAAESTLENIERHGIEVRMASPGRPGQSARRRRVNRKRYDAYLRYLQDAGREKFEWVLATDVRDLIFQGNPSAWLRACAAGHDLVVSSEGIAYQYEPWNRGHARAVYGELTYRRLFSRNNVLNAGLVAGSQAALTRLFRRVRSELSMNPGNPSDQVVLNYCLRARRAQGRVLYAGNDEAWCCHAGIAADPSLPEDVQRRVLDAPPIFAGGRVKNSQGREFCIVHQYDRVPAWGRDLHARYAGSAEVTVASRLMPRSVDVPLTTTGARAAWLQRSVRRGRRFIRRVLASIGLA